MHMEGRKPRSKYTKEKLKRIFTSWHIYLMSFLYVYVRWSSMLYILLINITERTTTALRTCSQFSSSMSDSPSCSVLVLNCYRYLRHSTNPRYSIPQINNYPTTTSGVQIIMTIIYACTAWAELILVTLLTAFRAIRYGLTGQTLAASCIRRSKFELISIFT